MLRPHERHPTPTMTGLAEAARHRLAVGRRAAPGVGISLAVAMVALFLASHYGAPVMLFALLLGMALGFLRERERVAPGIRLSTRTILRVGVALLGARLTLTDLTALGLTPVLITLATVAATLLVGFGVARALGMGGRFAVLSAGAVSICGASAALAIASTLPRDERLHLDTVLVVVSVSTLSTVALVIYPILAAQLGMDDAQAGVFLGATIHDVAQVVGAGFSVSETSGETATIIKLLRVALLLPLVLGLALVLRERGNRHLPGQPHKRPAPPIPGFLLGFLALVGINSLGWLPAPLMAVLATTSTACLITAVAALGIQSQIGEMLKLGWRPITVIVLQTLFMGAMGAMLVGYWLPA
ncbi:MULTISPECIES: YeiH family protein [Spiribacter]|nr:MULTISPECIES: putative sulfate exporter family transporter [Spiribacter]